MSKRKFGMIWVGLASLLLLVSPAGAVTLGITDSQNGWTVDYSLAYDVVGDHYSATMTIDTTAGAVVKGPWYITDLAFKFYEGSPEITYSNFSSSVTPAHIPPFMDGFYGFIINPGFPTGFAITDGGSFTFSFDFDSGDLVAKSDAVNFFVDYTGAAKNGPSGGESGYYRTNLSSYLTVPEPGTVLLLGSGLLGLALAGRKLRK